MKARDPALCATAELVGATPDGESSPLVFGDGAERREQHNPTVGALSTTGAFFQSNAKFHGNFEENAAEAQLTLMACHGPHVS